MATYLVRKLDYQKNEEVLFRCNKEERHKQYCNRLFLALIVQFYSAYFRQNLVQRFFASFRSLSSFWRPSSPPSPPRLPRSPSTSSPVPSRRRTRGTRADRTRAPETLTSPTATRRTPPSSAYSPTRRPGPRGTGGSRRTRTARWCQWRGPGWP